MNRMQVGKRRLQTQKVRGCEVAADVDIHREKRAAVSHGGEAANDNELDMAVVETLQQTFKIGHGVLSWLSGA